MCGTPKQESLSLTKLCHSKMVLITHQTMAHSINTGNNSIMLVVNSFWYNI